MAKDTNSIAKPGKVESTILPENVSEDQSPELRDRSLIVALKGSDLEIRSLVSSTLRERETAPDFTFRKNFAILIGDRDHFLEKTDSSIAYLRDMEIPIQKEIITDS